MADDPEDLFPFLGPVLSFVYCGSSQLRRWQTISFPLLYCQSLGHHLTTSDHKTKPHFKGTDGLRHLPKIMPLLCGRAEFELWPVFNSFRMNEQTWGQEPGN